MAETGGSVATTYRLGGIAGKIPAITGAALRYGVEVAMAELAEIVPYDTGLMWLSVEHNSNQYTATIESPVFYTQFQEFGFYNVLAQRWIPGRYFMMATGIALEVATEEKLAELLGTL